MPRNHIAFDNPVFKLADTEAGLAAGEDWKCQLTTAQLIPTTSTRVVPATGCSPATNIPNKSSWALSLGWLQDWTSDGGGLSAYAMDEEGELKWFSLEVDHDGFPTVVAKGQAYVVPGPYGGPVTAILPATASWPVLGTPDITPYTAP